MKPGATKAPAGRRVCGQSGGTSPQVSKPNDPAVPDQHRGFGMPAVTVKNTVRQDGMPAVTDGLFRPRLISVHDGLD
jgi:hypothetical protein